MITTYPTNHFDLSAMQVHLHPEAYALRPVRALQNGDLRYYDATTFPQNPWSGCEMYLRRLLFFGDLGADDSTLVLDILNANGDIIQDFTITRHGFEYLRRELQFRLVHDLAAIP